MKWEEVLVDSSRLIADWVVASVENKPELFGELMGLVYREEGILSDRASRAAFLFTDRHPEWIGPELDRLIKLALSTPGASLRKNVLRMISTYDFSGQEKDLGKLTDHCFERMSDPAEIPSVRIYSMSILQKIVVLEPDLQQEFHITIRESMPTGSTGFRSKGRKILQKSSSVPKG